MQARLFKVKIFLLGVAFCLLVACAQQSHKAKPQGIGESAWLNPLTFGEYIKPEGYLSSIKFNFEFVGADGHIFFARDCDSVLYAGDAAVTDHEYRRWQLLKDNCIAARKYFLAADTAISFWPKDFNYELVNQFPATAIPYLGGETLDGRTEMLLGDDSTFKFVEARNDNEVRLDVDNMDVFYTQIARADFNRDGVQDIFVRMDWYVKGAFGKGTDWVVLTKLSASDQPRMLWRK
jgi:hypothetical protein